MWFLGAPNIELGSCVGQKSIASAVFNAALTALTVKFAAKLANDGIQVNAAASGLMATAPGMAEMGARPIPKGAASIVWAATATGAQSGRFYRDGEALGW